MKHNETKREKEEFEWTKEDFMEEFQKIAKITSENILELIKLGKTTQAQTSEISDTVESKGTHSLTVNV